jgi:hypothetical protein
MSFHTSDYDRQQLTRLDDEICTILDSKEYRDCNFELNFSTPSLHEQVQCRIMKDKLKELRQDKVLWHQTIAMSHSTTIHNHCHQAATHKDKPRKSVDNSGGD